MMRLYSKGCEYALRALLQFDPEEGAVHGFARLCRKARTPEHFTRKMFQKLVQAKILVSVPGPNGGFRLKRPPSEVSLRDVIEAIDGKDAFTGCVLRMSACNEKRPCALHDTWANAKRALMPALEKDTLADLKNSL